MERGVFWLDYTTLLWEQCILGGVFGLLFQFPYVRIHGQRSFSVWCEAYTSTRSAIDVDRRNTSYTSLEHQSIHVFVISNS